MQSPASHEPLGGRVEPKIGMRAAGLIEQSFELRRDESLYRGSFVSLPANAYQKLHQHASDVLHADEMRYFASLPAERRRISFLLGRYAAKAALRACIGDVRFCEINIVPGVFKDPVVYYPLRVPWQVGITHSDSLVCALAFPAVHPMGLDIESIDAERASTMATQCLESERNELRQLGLQAPVVATVLWTAKEALSKTLRTGMTCPFALFEVHSVTWVTGSILRGFYRNLAQYKFQSWFHQSSVLTIALPKRTEIFFGTGELRFPPEIAGPDARKPGRAEERS